LSISTLQPTLQEDEFTDSDEDIPLVNTENGKLEKKAEEVKAVGSKKPDAKATAPAKKSRLLSQRKTMKTLMMILMKMKLLEFLMKRWMMLTVMTMTRSLTVMKMIMKKPLLLKKRI